MKISVFGNEYYEPDALPLKILPELKKEFPSISFITEDPNESNIPEDKIWWIMDTVFGLDSVCLIGDNNLKKNAPDQVSMHSFDLRMHLAWLKKLKPELETKIIGIPPQFTEEEAISGIRSILATQLSKNVRRN